MPNSLTAFISFVAMRVNTAVLPMTHCSTRNAEHLSHHQNRALTFAHKAPDPVGRKELVD